MFNNKALFLSTIENDLVPTKYATIYLTVGKNNAKCSWNDKFIACANRTRKTTYNSVCFAFCVFDGAFNHRLGCQEKIYHKQTSQKNCLGFAVFGADCPCCSIFCSIKNKICLIEKNKYVIILANLEEI